jgi:hypothetical protein
MPFLVIPRSLLRGGFIRLSSSLDNHNNFLLAAASNGAWCPSSLIEKGI